jgi:hypothetical protein
MQMRSGQRENLRHLGSRVSLWALLCALLAPLGGAGCQSVDGLVLVVTAAADQPIKSYVVKVQDRKSRKLVLHSGAQRFSKPRDLLAEPLRIALPAQPGTYLVQVLAANYENVEQLPRPGVSEPQLFFAGLFEVGAAREVTATLLPVPPSMDRDRDHFPDALPWMASLPEADAAYRDHPELLDCVDQDPPSGDLLPLRTRAFDIHPLVPIQCGVQLRPPKAPGATEAPPYAPFDTSCSGMPRACTDKDGDGEPESSDCDDSDARRFHGNPRPRNCCQCRDRKECETNHDKLADTTACQPKRCDTTFDFDCSGLPVECFTDDDCDGYAPDDPVPSQRDCDDHDPRVHPAPRRSATPRTRTSTRTGPATATRRAAASPATSTATASSASTRPTAARPAATCASTARTRPSTATTTTAACSRARPASRAPARSCATSARPRAAARWSRRCAGCAATSTCRTSRRTQTATAARGSAAPARRAMRTVTASPQAPWAARRSTPS